MPSVCLPKEKLNPSLFLAAKESNLSLNSTNKSSCVGKRFFKIASASIAAGSLCFEDVKESIVRNRTAISLFAPWIAVVLLLISKINQIKTAAAITTIIKIMDKLTASVFLKDLSTTLLYHISDSPSGLFLRGDADLLGDDRLKIAIVGTRRASERGVKLACQLAEGLAANGIIIVSGLAYGIDRAAHEGCLSAGGQTIAVLANGVEEIYPNDHNLLAEKILAGGGTLVSERRSEKTYKPQQFLERNRIISGLCGGVIIIEAPQKSGALNTAAHALAQNRDLFVVPGSVYDKNYVGSNNLLKQGAYPVTSAQDILDHYQIKAVKKNKLKHENLNQEQKVVLEAIQKQPVGLSIDNICQLTKLEPRVSNRIISSLLIDGIIQESNGKYYV